MNRLASYGVRTVTIDNRDRSDRLRVLEAECAALRMEVRRLRASATHTCPFCRITRELEGAVR